MFAALTNQNRANFDFSKLNHAITIIRRGIDGWLRVDRASGDENCHGSWDINTASTGNETGSI